MLTKNKSLVLSFPQDKQKLFNLKQVVLISTLIAFFVLALTLFVVSNRNNWGILKSIDSANYESLKNSLNELIDIKSQDQPTIIEVSNAANLKLQDSVLYTQVENSDLMLVYKDKVIIYRPFTNKIVNVFPVNN